MATEVEGLRLYLSIHSATGYKGVREINKTGRFRADGRTAYGKPVSFGTFATAVDAAVAYARAVAEMEGAESIAEDEAAAITPRPTPRRKAPARGSEGVTAETALTAYFQA